MWKEWCKSFPCCAMTHVSSSDNSSPANQEHLWDLIQKFLVVNLSSWRFKLSIFKWEMISDRYGNFANHEKSFKWSQKWNCCSMRNNLISSLKFKNMTFPCDSLWTFERSRSLWCSLFVSLKSCSKILEFSVLVFIN